MFGTCFQAKSKHEIEDLFINDSNLNYDHAGAYLSTFESPSLPTQTLRPADITIGGTAVVHPVPAIQRDLEFFAEGSKPRTAGIGGNNRVRIHSVNVKVKGETGVLIRGGK